MFDRDDKKKIDLDNLDAIIKRCEGAMVGKWKKKPEAAVIEISEEDDDAEDKPDIDGMDLDDLMQMYEELKDRK